MSLIDTLAPVILAVGFTAAVLMIVGAWAYRAIVAARLQHLDASHDRLCETRSRALVRDLVAAVETDPILNQQVQQQQLAALADQEAKTGRKQLLAARAKYGRYAEFFLGLIDACKAGGKGGCPSLGSNAGTLR